jgi:hypothetical protein
VLGIGAYAAAAGAELRPLSDGDMAGWLAAAAAAKPAGDLSSPQLPVSHPVKQRPLQPPLLPPAARAPATGGAAGAVRHHLVAYPAEDNFAGVIYPLAWINQVWTRSCWCCCPQLEPPVAVSQLLQELHLLS